MQRLIALVSMPNSEGRSMLTVPSHLTRHVLQIRSVPGRSALVGHAIRAVTDESRSRRVVLQLKEVPLSTEEVDLAPGQTQLGVVDLSHLKGRVDDLSSPRDRREWLGRVRPTYHWSHDATSLSRM